MVVVSSTFTPPDDGVLCQTPLTKLIINDQELGIGSLYITEHNVVWGGGVRSTGTAAPTISLLYPTISIHAIQREPSPALYMVINYELRVSELEHSGSGDDEDDDFDAEDQPITQLRFIPQNEGDLQAMYLAMTQGQALNPDPTDEVDEEEDDYMDGEEFDEGDEEFEDAEESNGGADQGVGGSVSGGPAGGQTGGPAGGQAGGPAGEAAARLRQLRLDHNGALHHDDDAENEDIGDN